MTNDAEGDIHTGSMPLKMLYECYVVGLENMGNALLPKTKLAQQVSNWWQVSLLPSAK